MKKSFIAIVLVFGACINVLSQAKRLSSNVWYSNVRLSGSEVWINNDSTYFLTYSGCIETSITKGKWTIVKDTFIFFPSSDFELYPKIDFVQGKGNEIIFFDYYNLPISDLQLTFVGDTSEIYQTTTDKNGKITLPSGQYHLLYFDNLVNMVYERTKMDSIALVHVKLNNGTGTYYLKFNYPAKILKNQQQTSNFDVDKEMRFKWTDKNELIDVGYDRKYSKKY